MNEGEKNPNTNNQQPQIINNVETNPVLEKRETIPAQPIPVAPTTETSTESKQEVFPTYIPPTSETGAPKEVYPTYQMPKTEIKKEPTPEKKEEPVKVEKEEESTGKKKRRKNYLARFFFLIILGLGGYIGYTYMQTQQLIAKMTEECTPVSTTKGEKALDLDSTIVKDLYSKVQTNIKEDFVNPEFDDKMKLYLAFRNIPQEKIYSSNCNLFSNNMDPYTCKDDETFTPHAFKEDTLQVEYKKLFGEYTSVQNQNIQLGRVCLGGYQYIADRGEYVEGYCKQEPMTQYRVDKQLTKATSKESIITLTENVKYIGAEGLTVPESLKSGTYIYTFKLDTNYNYILVSKQLQQ